MKENIVKHLAASASHLLNHVLHVTDKADSYSLKMSQTTTFNLPTNKCNLNFKTYLYNV